jgi:hypothetical protein
MRASLPLNDMVPLGLKGVQMQRRPLLLQVIRRIEMMICHEIKFYKIKINLFTLIN